MNWFTLIPDGILELSSIYLSDGQSVEEKDGQVWLYFLTNVCSAQLLIMYRGCTADFQKNLKLSCQQSQTGKWEPTGELWRNLFLNFSLRQNPIM